MSHLSGSNLSGKNSIRRRCLTQVTLPRGKLRRTSSALLSNHGRWPSCFGHPQQQLRCRPDSATPMHLLPDAGRVRRFEPAIEFLVAPRNIVTAGLGTDSATERAVPQGHHLCSVVCSPGRRRSCCGRPPTPQLGQRDAGAAVADSENRYSAMRPRSALSLVKGCSDWDPDLRSRSAQTEPVAESRTWAGRLRCTTDGLLQYSALQLLALLRA
ncbi:uncharacterized protein LOC144094928 [Amblyomma americanum]